MIDLIFNLTKGDIGYEIETYPNCFTCYFIHSATNEEWVFEISDRKNELVMFCLFIETLRRLECRMVGFNNIGFDYPVIHYIYTNRFAIQLKDIYEKAMAIIVSDRGDWSQHVWEKNHIVTQIDLYLIHHFDNKAVSLKILEFNMRSDTIEDLPYKPGTILTHDEIANLISYNRHDVMQTLKFYGHTTQKIKFREDLGRRHNKNFLCSNDVKIGTRLFVDVLENRSPGICYQKVGKRKQKRQTPRESIALCEVILPYINFTRPELQEVLDDYNRDVIKQTKGSVKRKYTFDNFDLYSTTGGIHGSVSNSVFSSTETNIVEDWDVKSYYPNLSIVNKFFPEHLSVVFCEAYEDKYNERKTHEKGTDDNESIKLSLNGVFGGSNSEHSPFYDPKYTMSITINGQLLLCKMMEMLSSYGMTFIQINTDGISIQYPREKKEWVHTQMKQWETLTGLELECVEYNRMFVRDVNNYIAEGIDGEIKRKGAYEYKLKWEKKHSMLVVKKAAEAFLLRGAPIADFIMNHEDIYDFMMIAKIPRNFKLLYGGVQIQNTTRYYASTDGDFLTKMMPPKGKPGAYKRANKLTDSYYNGILKEVGDNWDERIHTKNKSVYATTTSDVCSGYTVQVCNDMRDKSFTDINFDYYIKEAKKLVEIF